MKTAQPTTGERIAAAAVDLFGSQGFAATSMEQIRRTAAVSNGSLYHLFPSKAALAARLLADGMRASQGGVLEAIEHAGCAEDGVRGAVLSQAHWVDRNVALARLIYDDVPDEVVVAASPLFDRPSRDYVDITKRWLQRHAAEGSIIDVPFAVSHALWLGPTQEYCRHWLRGRAKPRPRQVAGDLRDRCVEGVVAVIAPPDFVEYARTSRYLDLIGPLYERVDDVGTVGLHLDERHTNSRGFVHAGVLVAVADTVMGHTVERASDLARMVTVSLTTDFVGSARTGQWLEGRATVRRVGRRISFATCEFRTDHTLVLAASAVFATTSPS